MKRDLYIQRVRDRNIYAHFLALIRSGMPRMQAYADTGAVFYLSEQRVRDIVRMYNKHNKNN